MYEISLEEAVQIMESIPVERLDCHYFRNCHICGFGPCDHPDSSEYVTFCFAGYVASQLGDYKRGMFTGLSKLVEGWSLDIHNAIAYGSPENITCTSELDNRIYRLAMIAKEQLEQGT